jgi:hypothetical protein
VTTLECEQIDPVDMVGVDHGIHVLVLCESLADAFGVLAVVQNGDDFDDLCVGSNPIPELIGEHAHADSSC